MRIASKFTAILFTAMLGCHCSGSTIPPVTQPPADTAMCQAACDHLAQLHCPEAQPLSDGTTCVAFCTQVQMNGHALNPTCVSTIPSCSAISTCR